MRNSPRIRRLKSDFRVLRKLQSESTIFSFREYGNPPDVYRVKFRGGGLAVLEHRVVRLDQHEVEIRLGANYPRVIPDLLWTTQIYHPNVSQSGAVCLGGYQAHWVPSLDLAELCEMLWDMLRYANYDVTSPYNRHAAGWAATQREFRFPIDDRPLRDVVAERRSRDKSALPGELESSDEIVIAELVRIGDDDDTVVNAEIQFID